MGTVVLNGATSGSTTLQPTDAVTVTCTLPSTGGTLQTSGSGYTANGVAYASSTSALTTGSALTFNGTQLGVTNGSGQAILKLNGTSTPEIDFYTSNTISSYIYAPSTSFQINTVGANPIIFSPNETERMRLDSSGNLGLGVTPSAWATFKAIELTGGAIAGIGTNQFDVVQNAYYDGAFKYKTTGAATFYQQAGASHAWYTAPSGTAGNAITFTQAMTLDTSGNLSIGTTGVLGGATNKLALYSSDLANTANTCTMKNGANSTGGYFARFVNYLDATIGSITQNTSTSVLYNTTSDYRLKENIQDAESASALIDALQVRQFDWKTDNTHQRYGFVAQELVTVAPEAVHQPVDPEEMMAVDYSKLVPMLVKEIQELRKRLNALESK